MVLHRSTRCQFTSGGWQMLVLEPCVAEKKDTIGTLASLTLIYRASSKGPPVRYETSNWNTGGCRLANISQAQQEASSNTGPVAAVLYYPLDAYILLNSDSGTCPLEEGLKPTLDRYCQDEANGKKRDPQRECHITPQFNHTLNSQLDVARCCSITQELSSAFLFQTSKRTIT
jgi:hypothetical protein